MNPITKTNTEVLTQLVQGNECVAARQKQSLQTTFDFEVIEVYMFSLG